MDTNIGLKVGRERTELKNTCSNQQKLSPKFKTKKT